MLTKPLFLLLTMICIDSAAQTLPYTLTILNEPFEELGEPISLSNGEVWDDPNYIIPLGFNFQLIDQVSNTLATDYPGGQVFPVLLQNTLNSLTPFGDDIIDAAGGELEGISPISYYIDGNEGSRIAKIEWKDAAFYDEFYEYGTTNNRITFQLWIYEGSNIIEYRYGPNSIKSDEIVYAFGGPMVGMTKNLDLEEFTWEYLWFLGGDIQNPTVSNYSDNVNPPDNSILLNATLPEGLVYRFTPTFVSVPEISKTETLKVYPTNANTNIQVDWQGENAQLTIRDISGRTIKNEKVIRGIQRIEISELAAGAYLLSVVENGSTHSVKFIKE